MLFRARMRTRIDRRAGRRASVRPRHEAMETRLAPAVATHLEILAPLGTVTAGEPFELDVAAEDDSGKIDTTYSFPFTATVSLAVNPGGSTLGVPLTTTLYMNNGVVSFSGMTLNQPGSGYELQVTSGSLRIATDPFSVASPRLVVSTPPPSIVKAGQPFGLTIEAVDGLGHVDTAYNAVATVGLVANPGGSTLGGLTTVLISNGVATFSGLTLDQPSPGYVLQVASCDLSPATTSPLEVWSPQLVAVTPPPSAVLAGQPFGLTFAAEDIFGNVVSSFTGTVTVALASNPGGATLGGTTTVTLHNGLASFSDLKLDKAGRGYALLAASSGLAPSSSLSSLAFDVVMPSSGTGSSRATSPIDGISAGPTRLVISKQPATVTAGSYFQLTLRVEDAQGQVESSYSGKVTVALASNPTGAVLGGTLTMPVQHGLLTFYGLTLSAAGSGYTIRATADGFQSAVSAPITAVDPPSGLGVVGPPPSSVAVHQSFGLTVAIQGVSGSLVHDYSGKVTIALVRKRGGATLRGPRTVQAVGGVAQFSGLSLRRARKGSAVALRITADGVGNAATVVVSIPARTRGHGPRKGGGSRR